VRIAPIVHASQGRCRVEPWRALAAAAPILFFLPRSRDEPLDPRTAILRTWNLWYFDRPARALAPVLIAKFNKG
jgi:hypothetical protein